MTTTMTTMMTTTTTTMMTSRPRRVRACRATWTRRTTSTTPPSYRRRGPTTSVTRCSATSCSAVSCLHRRTTGRPLLGACLSAYGLPWNNMINAGFFGSDSNKKKKTDNKVKRKKTRHPALAVNQPVIVDNQKLQVIATGGGISTTRRPLKSTTEAKSTTQLNTEHTFDTTRITTPVAAKTTTTTTTTTTAAPTKSETVS